MFILTFVSVLITFFLAYISLRTVKVSNEAKEISNKSLETSEKHLKLIADLEKERVRPYVLFSIYFENGKTYASVKNYGLTAAFNTKISIKPILTRAFSSSDEAENKNSIITSQEITYLPPNYEFRDFLGTSFTFFEEYKRAIFEGEVNFKNSEDVEFKENFQINLDNLKNAIPSDETPISASLEKTSKSSEKIADELKSLRMIAGILFEEQNKFSKRAMRKNGKLQRKKFL